MVMKDKLEKTNHKGPYYTMKKISIAFLALATAGFIIAIPTYISQMSKKKEIGLAQENSSEVNESEVSSEYESYNDQEI